MHHHYSFVNISADKTCFLLFHMEFSTKTFPLILQTVQWTGIGSYYSKEKAVVKVFICSVYIAVLH